MARPKPARRPDLEVHLGASGQLAVRRAPARLAFVARLRPQPDAGERLESKTWLTEDTGAIDSRDMLMAAAPYFRLDARQAQAIWEEVAQAVAGWRTVARDLGMRSSDLLDFESAFAQDGGPGA